MSASAPVQYSQIGAGRPAPRRVWLPWRATALATCFAAVLFGVQAKAQLTASDPARGGENADFVQKLNSQIPLDLEFRDSSGMTVRLGDLFGSKPVILVPVYYNCPSMCTLALNGTMDVLNAIPFSAGEDFTVVTFSFDHKETHILADQKKQAYLEQYSRPKAAEGWRFLVGDEASIKALTEAIGFSFQYVPALDEFAHRSGLVLATRDGVISRYFPGVVYEPRDVRFGLIEASEGRIGSAVEKLFLLCYHYDPAVGSYGLVISRVINFSCILTVLVLGAVLFAFFRKERVSRILPANA